MGQVSVLKCRQHPHRQQQNPPHGQHLAALPDPWADRRANAVIQHGSNILFCYAAILSAQRPTSYGIRAKAIFLHWFRTLSMDG